MKNKKENIGISKEINKVESLNTGSNKNFSKRVVEIKKGERRIINQFLVVVTK